MKKPICHTIESLRALCEEVGNCWEWTRPPNSCGLPQIRHDGKVCGARKLAYVLAGGAVKAGMVLVPGCQNPKCINPACTKQMTKTNCGYVSAKSQVAGLVKRKKISDIKRKAAKLNMELVEEIRSGDKPSRQWARETGISLKTILNARHGRTWQDYHSPFAGLGARA